MSVCNGTDKLAFHAEERACTSEGNFGGNDPSNVENIVEYMALTILHSCAIWC